MHLIDPKGHSRRAFLRRSGQLAIAGTALPFALNLAAMGEAAAQAAAGDDYKALVCIFMYGGNDHANTVVNYDADSYTRYSTIRGGNGDAGGGVALAKASLDATVLNPATALPGARQYALHPSMKALADVFNNPADGKLAIQLNVGPLVVTLTRVQYANNNRTLYPVPAKLFSHNDQQATWQSSAPEGSVIGWGGTIGDQILGGNTNSLFTCISVSGNAVFLSGRSALQYQVSTGGAVGINSVTNPSVYGSSSVKSAMTQLVQQSRSNMLENEYNKVTARSIAAEGQVTSAIAPATFSNDTFAGITNNSLAEQLKMVARLIRGRTTLGAKRQVFFVSMGGFDLHDSLIGNHPALLQRMSDAMAAFHRQMVAQGIGDKVTTFTASDFGRTLASNGDGTDHGWGSHHFMLGGAVKGRAFYGTAPPVSITNTTADNDQWHVGQGRLLPTTSVDQYAGTLAKWFGVPDGELNAILPSLKNFGVTAPSGLVYPRDMGFMA